MNKLYVLAMASLVAVSGVASADAGPTVTTKSVSYSCQNGKSVKVSYGFNKQKLPTYAKAKVNGRTRTMPINLDRSDIAGTTFGKDGGYTLGADAMDLSNYRDASILITAPNNQIVYKDCSAN